MLEKARSTDTARGMLYTNSPLAITLRVRLPQRQRFAMEPLHYF